MVRHSGVPLAHWLTSPRGCGWSQRTLRASSKNLFLAPLFAAFLQTGSLPSLTYSGTARGLRRRAVRIARREHQQSPLAIAPNEDEAVLWRYFGLPATTG